MTTFDPLANLNSDQRKALGPHVLAGLTGQSIDKKQLTKDVLNTNPSFASKPKEQRDKIASAVSNQVNQGANAKAQTAYAFMAALGNSAKGLGDKVYQNISDAFEGTLGA